jgi:hypothetical protein
VQRPCSRRQAAPRTRPSGTRWVSSVVNDGRCEVAYR